MRIQIVIVKLKDFLLFTNDLPNTSKQLVCFLLMRIQIVIVKLKDFLLYTNDLPNTSKQLVCFLLMIIQIVIVKLKAFLFYFSYSNTMETTPHHTTPDIGNSIIMFYSGIYICVYICNVRVRVL